MAHFDLLSPRKGKDDKTRWHKIGAAFPRDKGGFQLVLDSLPLADSEGRVTLMMWEAKPRDTRQRDTSDGSGGSGSYGGGYGAGGRPGGDLDDDLDSIPF
ncbi:RNA-binding protein [Haematobacter massiliensis]|uniref:RNA-binding protein n=1 Tax=Haematobacter massiliensis TaxID=195105 RepID=A0A086XX35_9RHOB|nr:hypothetical protein [Haematobacter massiliensis]KFI26585.1 RNA-binding protein [Haematobacter massiliensis]OWJ86324.1 hypothetical protein CDV51_10335 [Haematobacter massiliensis]